MLRRFIALLFLTIAFIAVSNVSSQTQQKWEKFFGATFRVNQYGVLEELKDINGDNYFEKSAPPPHDGYAIAYQILDPKTNKPVNLQIVYATSDKVSTDQLKIINSGNSLSGEIKPNVKGCGEVIPASHCKLLAVEVQTKDGVLQIANEFWGLGPKDELGIARRIKNLSQTSVQLLALEVQLDDRFYPPVQLLNKRNNLHHQTRALSGQGNSTPIPNGGRGGGANDGGRGGGNSNDGNRDRSRNSVAVFRAPWVTGPIVCPPELERAVGHRDRLRIPEFPTHTEIRCNKCSQVVFSEGELPESLLEKLDCEPRVETDRWTSRSNQNKKTGREPIILKPGEMVAIFTTPKLLKPSK